MVLRRLLAPWSGDLLRHRPKGSTRSVIDDRHLGEADANRWSVRGLRAYYFALDVGIVAAEHARHIALDLPAGHSERIAREVFRVHVALDRTLDLTDPRVVAAMGAEPIDRWILDVRRTQAASSYLLAHVPGLQGLIVPSVAFLDDHARTNIVVFRDAIDRSVVFSVPVFTMDIVLEASGA